MAKADADSSSPFGRAWFVSGALVLLALAMVAFMVWRGVTGEDKPADVPVASSPVTSAAPTMATETAAEEGQCKPLRVKEKGLPAEAPEVQWERHPSGGVVPVSKKYGPTSREGAYWRCSARTASGAVVSGISLAYNFGTGDKNSASDDPNRETLFRKSQFGSNVEFGTVEGYRVLLSNENEAEVEYLLSGPGFHGTMRVPMVWDESTRDWTINAKSNDLGVAVVEDTTGFTMWR